MPGETSLMRCWYAAKLADQFPGAKIIISLPGDTADSLSSVQLMRKELVIRGIAKGRIFFENTGTNTRGQALSVWKILFTSPFFLKERGSGGEVQLSPVTRHPSLLIVTSPEHLYRSVLTFNKAGFLKVDGIPAFERAIESDITFNAKKIGGRKWIPDVGESIAIRYGFWTQIRYEQLMLREWMAVGYYWLIGLI
jgi:hypothetical protein